MIPSAILQQLSIPSVQPNIADSFSRVIRKNDRHYAFSRSYNDYHRDIVVRDVVQYMHAIGIDEYPVTQYLINDVMRATSRTFPVEIERAYEWRHGVLHLYLDSKAIEANKIFINLDAIWRDEEHRET